MVIVVSLLIFLLSILLLIFGAIKKGSKGNRSGWWMASFVSGIVLTSVMGILIIPLFLYGVYLGASDVYYRGKATHEIAVAKITKDPADAKLATKYILKAIQAMPEGDYAKKDRQILEQAKQLDKKLAK